LCEAEDCVTQIYFSDFFQVPPQALEDVGAFDVSLINDLPLFVDPFLLFNSEKPIYQSLHAEIIQYMKFLRDATLAGPVPPPLVDRWFAFPEVKQNWLGFSQTGNKGHGLGRDFARALHRNFSSVFSGFGEETLTRSSHLEKLCLIRDGVGRDTISDFTTNLIKRFLAEFSQNFAQQALPAALRRKVSVPKVSFNYQTRSWSPQTFELPYINGDYVLLTPKDILTKDEAWINRADLIDRFEDIAEALPDSALRAQVNEYLLRVLPEDPDASKEKIREAITRVIERFPQVLDYYIRDKEEHGDDAVSVSKARVQVVEARFIEHVRQFVRNYLDPGGFYQIPANSYDEAKRRLLFLKDVIENKGGHRIFYLEGKPIEREADLHILYRLTWFATPFDVSREVNDGRGPADFKVSTGAIDKTLVEFKLAKNTQLARNLEKQTEIYEKASGATHPSLKAIFYFSEDEMQRVWVILQRLKLEGSPHIVLIDASADNKPSGSKA
jgi:hypothetical protein